MEVARRGDSGLFRVGLIVPSSNTTMEEDFHGGLKGDVLVCTTRMWLEETTREHEERMLRESLPIAAELIRTLRPHLAVFGCTSAGSLRGMEGDRKIVRELEERTGAPAISILSSLGEEFAELGVRRLAVFTPYVEDLNRTVRQTLEEMGYPVLSIHGMGIRDNLAIGRVRPEEILAFARERFRARGAECLFFSCTNLAAVRALPLLREAFDLPITTSNLAALRAVERRREGRERGAPEPLGEGFFAKGR